MARSLYICYFGVREPLVQTQVIPYLRELANGGHDITLLTFEPAAFGDGEQAENAENEIRKELLEQQIEWDWLKYHKRFSVLATAWDIFRGTLRIRSLITGKRVEILHGRVHVPTLMGALARKFSRRKPKLLFDIRGFFPEEYTDAGVWPAGGIVYRTAKSVEGWLMKEADGFVVLTEKARHTLFPGSERNGFDRLGRPVEVIPCCVDFEGRFRNNGNQSRELARSELGVTDRFVISHVGALGGLYLNEELADLLKAAKSEDPSLFAIFLTQSDPVQIVPLLRERGFTDSDFIVRKVPSNEVPKYLAASDIGLSLVKATYATISRSPTKIPEYLAAGLPIIANRGVGDVDHLIEGKGVGAVIDDFSPNAYVNAFKIVKDLPNNGEQCRRVARQEFDLRTVGRSRYQRIYDRLMERV